MEHINVGNTGWRKPTAELCVSEQYAKAGQKMAVSKMQALVAVKRVSAKIGLRAADMMLLDLMCALSQPQDWEEGSRPIVWPSNHFLAEQLGLSERAIQRHARKLGDLGLICFKDNSNGHRRGKRDANGHIIEAYGFDLSPLKARAGEFELFYEEVMAERQFVKLMRKHITISRRSIRTMVHLASENGLEGQWNNFDAKLDQLIETIPNRSTASEVLAEVAQAFLSLHEEVKQTYERAQSIEHVATTQIETVKSKQDLSSQNTANLTHKLTCFNDQNDRDILNTNYKHNIVKRKFERVENLPQQAKTSPVKTKDAYEKNEADRAGDTKNLKDVPTAINDKVTPEMVKTACPEFISYAKAMGVIDDKATEWRSLIIAANSVYPTIGISQREWNQAIFVIGENSAAIAMALIFDKYAAQEISTPNGYLRALTARAAIGELHLAKSIYGRLINP